MENRIKIRVVGGEVQPRWTLRSMIIKHGLEVVTIGSALVVIWALMYCLALI